MRNQIAAQVNSAQTYLLLLIIGLTPILFASLTTEFYETPKLIFLGLSVGLLLLLKTFAWVLEGKVLITRTPIDLPLILLLVVIILSSVLSPVQQIAFIGNVPRFHGSAVSWAIYVLFYFLAVSHLKQYSQIKGVLITLLISATVLAIISLLSYFGLFLPFDFAKFVNFTPTGSSFTTAALLALLLPFTLLSYIHPNRLLHPWASLAIASLFAVTIVLIGSTISMVIAILAVLLVLFSQRMFNQSIPSMLSIPIGLAALFFLLSVVPIRGNANILQQKYQNFPREVQLPFVTSWKVSAGSFRDAPFLGIGPNTYLFSFTLYKPAEYNYTQLWNIRFDSAFDEYLQFLGTVGGLGVAALLFLSTVILNLGWKGISLYKDNPLNLSLCLSAILVVAVLALHSSSVVFLVTAFSLLACYFALHRGGSDRTEELTIGIKASTLTDSNLVVGDVLPLLIFIPIVVLVAFTLIKGSSVVLADYHHRLALNLAASQGLQTYNELVAAESLNPNVDLYRTDLAQTNLALANAIAVTKGPTQSSPSGSLTDTDKQNIQTLISQAINEGQAATTLNPLSVQNWEILASLYRQISGVAQNALQFSLNAYGRAIQRDPLNPILRLNVGGVYYSIKNYDLAIRFFGDSVNLKSDYANAYYNLAVAYKDKGDLQSAAATAEQLVTLIDPKSPDYKTAASFLSDLKSQLATGSAQTKSGTSGNTTPPAAQENAPLQSSQLPKVINLPAPEQAATPAAIKK